MLWLDIKYAAQLESQLRNFKRKGNNTFNFSCPVCGDSSTHKRKARGYLFVVKQQLEFKCHNCGISMPFHRFLQSINDRLYSEYRIERLKDAGYKCEEVNTGIEDASSLSLSTDPFSPLKKISQLAPDHIAKLFVDSRKIPTKYHFKLFFANKFKTFTNTILPGKFEEDKIGKDEPRIVIPFINKDKKVHGFQGRSLFPNPIKYITIITDPNTPKIYGLDTVDLSKKVYTFEGPIDSMFIDNAIATAGGDLEAATAVVSKEQNVIVYDNEPRSIHTIKKLEKAVEHGYNVCIWPESITQKDINDMILAGYSSDYLKYVINNNTYSGLKARMAISQWKK